jgi:hypothetical protein
MMGKLENAASHATEFGKVAAESAKNSRLSRAAHAE